MSPIERTGRYGQSALHIEKQKLPKGMSYPLKSSVLKTALDQAGITTDTVLLFAPDHMYFEAFFWPPNERIDYERFYIRTGALSAREGGRARELMQRQVILDFLAWAKVLLAKPLNSPIRQKQAHFFRYYPDAAK